MQNYINVYNTCPILYSKEDAPEDRHIQMIRWKVLASGAQSNRCTRKIDWFKTDRMYCMEIELPVTKIVTLKPGVCMDYLDDKDRIYTEKDESPPVWAGQYRTGCGGDSGSGQFVTNGYKIKPENFHNLRCILTSVYTTSHSDLFTHQGEWYNVPCGTYSYNADESKKSGYQDRVYFQAREVSQSTTYPDTLEWIKQKAKLCIGPCKVS